MRIEYTGRAVILNPVLRDGRNAAARLDECEALARAIELGFGNTGPITQLQDLR